MTFSVVSLYAFEKLFADYIQASFGISQDKIRLSYSQNGQPFSDIDEDVMYLNVSEEQNEISQYKQRKRSYDSETEQLTISQSSMRELSLRVVFYGPNCDTNAALLREGLFLEASKEFLYKNNLSLIPDKTNISSIIHEEVNSRYWKRVDMNIYFYNSVTVGEEINIIKSADIIIKTDLEV